MPEPMGPMVDAVIAGIPRGKAPHPEDEAWDVLADYKAQRRARVWAQSLAADGHRGVTAPFTALGPEMEPMLLRKFLDGVGDAQAPRTLILAGSVGCGKTTAAITVAATAVAEGHMARFTRHGTYLAALRPGGLPESAASVEQYLDRLRGCAVLVLDDLCANMRLDGITEWARAQTADLIDHRLNAGRATIVTTNLTGRQIADALGEVTFSRLAGNAVVVRCTGPDRRGRVTW